ncbi:MAG: hypothetical protein ACKVZJ_09795 [Phycisphaerales bacterium]
MLNLLMSQVAVPTEVEVSPDDGTGGVVVPARRLMCECPRCGYDLSGLPPTWEELCPTTGTCSECGLEVEWSELLGRHTPPPEWFAERHKSKYPPEPLMSARTWWRVMRPSVFWSSVKLGHRVDDQALFGFSVIALLMIWGCGAAWVLMFASGVRGGTPWPAGLTGISLVWPFSFATSPFFWIVPASSVLAPLVFFVLRSTLEKARVRQQHVWRAGVYGVLGVATIMLGFRLARVLILIAAPRGNVGIPTDPLEFLVKCGFRASWAMLAAAVWLGIFWWYAISKYMKLDSPRAVTAAIMVIALLGGLAVVQWWPGNQWDWWRTDLFRVFFW